MPVAEHGGVGSRRSYGGRHGPLNGSVRLIEELLEGSIIEHDFREEFVTYWGYKAHSRGENLFSLITPSPPSRAVQVWRGKGLEIVGEDKDAIADWVRRRFGDKTPVKTEQQPSYGSTRRCCPPNTRKLRPISTG